MSFDGLTSPLSSAISISSPPRFSSPPPPPPRRAPPSVNTARRRSPLSEAEKLDKVFECLRIDVYFSKRGTNTATDSPRNDGARAPTAVSAANGALRSIGGHAVDPLLLAAAEHLYRLPNSPGSLSPLQGRQATPIRASWPVRPLGDWHADTLFTTQLPKGYGSSRHMNQLPGVPFGSRVLRVLAE